MKDWSLITRRSFELLTQSIKQKNKDTMELNGIENLYLIDFQVLEDMWGLEQLYQVLTEQVRKNTIRYHNLVRLFSLLIFR